MPVQFTVRVFDSTVTVELDDSLSPAVREEIAAQWAQLHTDPDDRAPRLRLMLPGREASKKSGASPLVSPSEAAAPDHLATELTMMGLRGLAGTAFLFHAAGLALDDGRVVAFVGPSGRGKTTVARNLGAAYGYVSDETVAFLPDLSVIPYPKPLSIGSRPGVKKLHAPAELGLLPVPGALRLAALVLLHRDPAVTEPRVETVPLDEALGELVPQTSSLARIPRPLHSLVDVISATGGVRRMVYGGVEGLQAMLPEILRTRADAPAVSDAPSVLLSSVLASGVVARAPYADALMIEDKLAVLGSTQLHVLAGIGPALWGASDGVSIEVLHARLESIYGRSPDGQGLSRVTDAVSGLTAAGVLQRG